MNIEIKRYMPINRFRVGNIKVIQISLEDLKQDNLEKGTIIYEGSIDDAPTEITNLYYYKVLLGKPVIFYVCEEK